jgi:ATP synthase protein I
MVRAALRGRVTGSSWRASGIKMADNARDGNEPEKRQTDEAALSARLRRLGDQLGQQRPGESSETQRGRPVADASGYARGFRLSSELVAGVLVGAAIGWALDRLLGISPWGLIVFLLLGFAAGVVNVMRAAGVAPEHDSGASPEGGNHDTT